MIKKGEYLSTLLRSTQTVFSFKDISLLWGDSGTMASRVRINSYIKAGKLHRIRRGLYAKDKNYDRAELAVKIFTPAYISFETVLGRAGVTFQHYGQIFVASYLTREISADGQSYAYKRLADAILTNPAGVDNKSGYACATPERAFLDTLYLHKDYHFDNLDGLDWVKMLEILPIYGNKRMENRVKEYSGARKANS